MLITLVNNYLKTGVKSFVFKLYLFCFISLNYLLFWAIKTKLNKRLLVRMRIPVKILETASIYLAKINI